MYFKDIHARLNYLLTRVSASYGAAELSRRLSRHILDNPLLHVSHVTHQNLIGYLRHF